MVREIVKPTGNTYLLQLPDDLIGKTVEVIAFEVKDTEPVVRPRKTTAEIMAELEGLTVDMTGFKFDRDEANDYD